MFITSLFSRLSVRTRVIALGLIPVVGFLANAIAFKIGDTQVGRSFDSVQADTTVADATHDLKIRSLDDAYRDGRRSWRIPPMGR